MKDKIYKVILTLAFLVLMAAILDFEVGLMINVPMILYVVVGTALLTLIYGIRGQKRYRILIRIRFHLIITGAIITFLSELSLLTDSGLNEDFNGDLIKNFLPIFYAMFLILFLDIIRIDPKDQVKQQVIMKDPASMFHTFNLTKREMSIAEVLLEDLSNKEIGDRFYIAENTVKKHVHNIFKKTGVKNRTEFMHLFLEEKGGD